MDTETTATKEIFETDNSVTPDNSDIKEEIVEIAKLMFASVGAIELEKRGVITMDSHASAIIAAEMYIKLGQYAQDSMKLSGLILEYFGEFSKWDSYTQEFDKS